MSPVPFDLWKVETFPVHVPGNANMSTILTSKPYAIAIAKQFPRVYIVFNDAHDANIKNGMLDITQGGVHVIPRSHKSCVKALFSDNVDDVKQLCSFTVKRQSVKPVIVSLDEQRVIISNVDTFQLYCGSELRNVTGCQLCLYVLPCSCAVVYSDSIIPATVSKCLTGVSNMTKLHGFLKHDRSSAVLSTVAVKQFIGVHSLGTRTRSRTSQFHDV